MVCRNSMAREIIQTLNGLSRDQAIEAAHVVSRSLVGDEPVDERQLTHRSSGPREARPLSFPIRRFLAH
jgi:hypothetical protein